MKLLWLEWFDFATVGLFQKLEAITMIIIILFLFHFFVIW